MTKPKKLVKGNTIGIVGPANFASMEEVKRGTDVLNALGYKTVIGESCGKQWYSFSGQDKLRADVINRMFSDKTIDAVLCMRGGYGCNRLIDYIDFDIVKSNPKLFIGYSDVTTLHCAFQAITNLVTIHGPMLTSNIANDFDDFTKENFFKVVEGRAEYIPNPPDREIEVLVEGYCKGKLGGGNLALAEATLGTKYSLDAKDKILFLEDIGEYSYRIDKMLYHMKHSGVFDDCIGVVVGDFKKCEKEKLIAEKKKQEYINFINSLKEQANIKIFVDRQNDRLFDYYGGRQFAVFRLNTPKDFDKYSPGLQKLSWKNEPHSTLILRPVHRSFNKVGRGLTGTGEFNYQKFEI